MIQVFLFCLFQGVLFVMTCGLQAHENLKRNYCNDCVSYEYENECDYCISGADSCFKHSGILKEKASGLFQGIPLELIYLTPNSGTCVQTDLDCSGGKCIENDYCGHPGVYIGYFSKPNSKYIHHYYNHLLLLQQNSDCVCYWPEKSITAAEISNKAYYLFKNLFTNTILAKLVENIEECEEFLECRILESKVKHVLTVFCIANQHWFSDYYEICYDIGKYVENSYSTSKCTYEEYRFVQDELNGVLDALYPDFEILYENCLTKHPHPRIELELEFLRYVCRKSYNNRSKIVEESASNQVSVFESQKLLEQGEFFNSLLLFKKAIPILTHALEIDKFNCDAYIERAIAYFETNQIALALKDYEQAKLLSPIYGQKMYVALYVPKKKIEFTKGLTTGIVRGINNGAEEFVPSLLNTFTGLSNGLWAFATEPIQSSQLMANAAYEIATYISATCLGECTEALVPELKTLKTNWDTLDDEARGYQIGYIIGKYGVDIFGGCGAIKGIQKLTRLRHANAMVTLAACASPATRTAVLNQSTKIAAARAKLIATTKKGKILIRNPNVAHHVMQKKHAWEKVVNLTGNVEVDFRRVMTLLEEKGIQASKFLKETETVTHGIIRTEHEISFANHKIRAIFIEYIESGEKFLNNAWVVVQ